jgi:hypothetical protein
MEIPKMRLQSNADDFILIYGVNNDALSYDLLIVAELRRADFSARIDTWVLRENWQAFCDDLYLLERKRQGQAKVESISPKELSLCIRSTDSSGHMAVEGSLGYRGIHGEVQLAFSPMPFCPSVLPELLRDACDIAGISIDKNLSLRSVILHDPRPRICLGQTGMIHFPRPALFTTPPHSTPILRIHHEHHRHRRPRS